jgi:hypothetical protein
MNISAFIVDRICMRNKTKDKRKIINEECDTRVATYEYSSLIIFLLSYVLLRMPIRSKMKGDSFSRRKCSFNHDWNYSTCWILGADGTRGWNRSKRHRTLGELAYANSNEWRSAQLIAPVCAGLKFWAHCWRILLVSCSVFSLCLSAILVFVVHVHMPPPPPPHVCLQFKLIGQRLLGCLQKISYRMTKSVAEWESLLPSEKVCCRMTKSVAEWESLLPNDKVCLPSDKVYCRMTKSIPKCYQPDS